MYSVKAQRNKTTRFGRGGSTAGSGRADDPSHWRRRHHLDQDNAANRDQGLPATRYDAQQSLLLSLLLTLIAPLVALLLQRPLVREHCRSVVEKQAQAVGAPIIHLLESEPDFRPCHDLAASIALRSIRHTGAQPPISGGRPLKWVGPPGDSLQLQSERIRVS